jgi:ketosteroid isomerase-like protein
MSEDFVGQALKRQDAANGAMFNGDPEPYLAMWSRQEPVSLFGAWGPCKTSWPDLEQTFRWVGSRFGGGSMATAVEIAYAGRDVAYTVGYEQGPISVDGGPERDMRIRVTHIYRLEDGQWRLVHRHGDFAPVDESPKPRG